MNRNTCKGLALFLFNLANFSNFFELIFFLSKFCSILDNSDKSFAFDFHICLSNLYIAGAQDSFIDIHEGSKTPPLSHTRLWSLGRWYLSPKFWKFKNWLKVTMFDVKQHSWWLWYCFKHLLPIFERFATEILRDLLKML